MLRIETPDFNLEATLESGQVFGFRKNGDGFYEGVIRDSKVRLRQREQTLDVRNGRGARFAKALRDYFDLDRDLTPVYQLLLEDKRIAHLAGALRGLRLIRQDSWEALAGFIISSNNNIKRIQGIWRNLTSRLSQNGFSFPKPSEIACRHERTLRELGLGYRASFLLRTAQFIAVNPVCLDLIREAEYHEAKERLIQFPGIGPKVADCVLLYGFQKHEAFPVDVWILKVMRAIFFRSRNVSEEKITCFGQKKWRALAGYVQQYLFHAARNHLL